MSYYEFLKFVHIVMAIVWVGGAVALQILAFRIQRENNPPRLVAFSRDAGFLGERVFAPASIILLVAGILMVIDSWDFSDAWIIIGLVGFLATLITGIFYLTPASKKVGDLLEQRGPDDVEVRSTIARLIAISRVDLTVLVVVVFSMVAKPGL